MVHHAKELKVGRWLLKALSKLEVDFVPSEPSKSKVFVLELPDFCEDSFVGTVSLLCSLHKLEKLVIRIRSQECSEQSSHCYDPGNYYRESQSTKEDSCSLLSHLKTVEIFGLGGSYNTLQNVLPLVEFVDKNAKGPEKAIIYEAASSETENLWKMAKILLSFPRCSPRAVILFCK